MASKITTDDPKHHKYVTVNKRERKKQPKRSIKLVSLLFPRWMHEATSGWRLRWHSSGIFSTCHPILKKGTKIIFDDCNHKTYRVMVKTQLGWRFVKNTGCFATNYRRYRYERPRYKSCKRFIRWSWIRSINDVEHYKRTQYAY